MSVDRTHMLVPSLVAEKQVTDGNRGSRGKRARSGRERVPRRERVAATLTSPRLSTTNQAVPTSASPWLRSPASGPVHVRDFISIFHVKSCAHILTDALKSCVTVFKQV